MERGQVQDAALLRRFDRRLAPLVLFVVAARGWVRDAALRYERHQGVHAKLRCLLEQPRHALPLRRREGEGDVHSRGAPRGLSFDEVEHRLAAGDLANAAPALKTAAVEEEGSLSFAQPLHSSEVMRLCSLQPNAARFETRAQVRDVGPVHPLFPFFFF